MADTTMGMTMAVPTRTLAHMTHTTTTKTCTDYTTNNLPDIPSLPKTISGEAPRFHTSRLQRTAHPLAAPLNLPRQSPSGHRTTPIPPEGGTTTMVITLIMNVVGPRSLLRLHRHWHGHHNLLLHLDHDPNRTPLSLTLPPYRRLTLNRRS